MTPTQIPEEFREWAKRYADRNSIDAHPRIREHLNAELYEAAINTYRFLSAQQVRWVKCTERMPQLPNPLPADTPDERPVIFFNLRHSSTGVWFPSYGIKSEDQFPLEANVNRSLYDEGFGREYWEWLDEPTASIQ